MSAASGGEKEYEPTQKRLDEAFDRGNFPKSTDFLGSISIILMGVFSYFNGDLVSTSLSRLLLLYRSPENLGGYSPYYLTYDVIITSFVIMAVSFVFISISALILSRFRLSLLKLIPKVERLSWVGGFKNKFGFRSIKNGFGMISKLLVVATFVYLSLPKIYEILCIQCLGDYHLNLLGLLAYLVILMFIYFIVGVLDYFLRAIFWRSELRMSREEFIKEQRDQEGDAALKSQRRRLAIDMLGAGGSVTAVVKADVVIVNPTHYAVAISWQRDSSSPPTVLAKGVDQMALLMRDQALKNNIPQYRDPIAARSIYSTVKVGKPIERRHYRAVASAIRFSSMMRKSPK